MVLPQKKARVWSRLCHSLSLECPTFKPPMCLVPCLQTGSSLADKCTQGLLSRRAVAGMYSPNDVSVLRSVTTAALHRPFDGTPGDHVPRSRPVAGTVPSLYRTVQPFSIAPYCLHRFFAQWHCVASIPTHCCSVPLIVLNRWRYRLVMLLLCRLLCRIPDVVLLWLQLTCPITWCLTASFVSLS